MKNESFGFKWICSVCRFLPVVVLDLWLIMAMVFPTWSQMIIKFSSIFLQRSLPKRQTLTDFSSIYLKACLRLKSYMKPLKGKRLKCQAMQVLNVGDSKICAPLHYGEGLTLLLLSNSLSDLILLIQS